MIIALTTVIISLSHMGLSQECFNEDCEGVGSFERSKLGRAILDRRPELRGGLAMSLKSRSELDSYFACHIVRGLGGSDRRQAESRLKEFQTHYQPILEMASQHFQMPYALSACLMFRESKFDPNVSSPKNAQGIAQFTADTYTRLRGDIANVHEMERGETDYLKNHTYEDLINYTGFDNMWMRYTQLLQGEGILNRQLSPEELKKGRDIGRQKLTAHARYKPIVQSFDSFLMDVSRYMSRTDTPKSIRDRRRQLFPNTPAGQFPSGNDLNPPAEFSKMLQEPAWVIGMNMFYLRQQLLDVDSQFKQSGFDPGNDVIGLLVTLGGGYNQGNGALNDFASSGRSLREVCTQLATKSETRDYMISLRRCMTRGSFQPPTGPESTSECASEDRVAPITDPCALPGEPTSEAIMRSPRPRPRPTPGTGSSN